MKPNNPNQPYTAVVILGSKVICDTNKNPFCDNGIIELYQAPGRIYIGDGVKGFELRDLVKLKNKIDNTTRIDVLAHGSMSSVISHTTQINNKESISTSLLLAAIKRQTETPLHVHLWQCEGGGADMDAGQLSPGSILITHTSSDKTILIVPSELIVMRSLDATNNNLVLSAEEHLMRHIAINLITPEFTITKVNDKGKASEPFKIRTPLSSITAPETYIKERAEDLAEFLNISNCIFKEWLFY